MPTSTTFSLSETTSRLCVEKPLARPPAFKDVLRSIAEHSTIWFTLVDKDSDEFVGHCAIRAVKAGPIDIDIGTSASASVGVATGGRAYAKNRDGEFPIPLRRELRGRGLGTEAARFTIGRAFGALGLHRVSLVVLEGNLPARALFAKNVSDLFLFHQCIGGGSVVPIDGGTRDGLDARCACSGFQEEGRKRRGNWADGRWEDIIYMGILEEEWAARTS